MTASASDRKAIRRAEKAARLADRERGDVITSIMSTASGRAWVWDLLTTCHIFHNPFTGDPSGTAFACGEMNIGQRLLADITRWCPDYYTQAMREANDRSIHASAAERTGSPDTGWDTAEPADDAD